MPTLPTFEVTQPVADRILAVFQGKRDSNGNPLTPTQAYKLWLRDHLAHHVRTVEAANDPLSGSDLPLT
jgi:hypothetical protein